MNFLDMHKQQTKDMREKQTKKMQKKPPHWAINKHS